MTNEFWGKPRNTPNKQGATLEEIAELYGCTRERVRQIEAKALAQLKRVLWERGLTSENILPDNSVTDKDY